VCACERFAIICIGDIIIVSVYLPCAGTANREFMCDEIINDINYWIDEYPQNKIVLGGDLNCNLNDNSQITNLLNDFIDKNNLTKCTLKQNHQPSYTYYNDATGCCSVIDYFLSSNILSVSEYRVLDVKFNLSDHCPIIFHCKCIVKICTDCSFAPNSNTVNNTVQTLRWDRGQLQDYSDLSGTYLLPLYELMRETVSADVRKYLNYFYDELLKILVQCSDLTIPKVKKNFFKFWWDQELSELKQRSIESSKAWKEAGNPKFGIIFEEYRKDKGSYKNCLRKHQKDNKIVYSNELHDALMKKDGPQFWKCWRSKLETPKQRINQINGISDPSTIANQFANHFSKISGVKSDSHLRSIYEAMRLNYSGFPITAENTIDAELVERVINRMPCGKAAGLDNITIEHLRYCHPILPAILARLFNMFIHAGFVPDNFCVSFTVPLLKGNVNANSKSLNLNDFRGITISPTISKVFEHCILMRYGQYFESSDNQFGFKKNSGCAHAVYTLRKVVDFFVERNSTVNICSLDLSKAFDRMNHFGLFIKLMTRQFPVQLLNILEFWFKIGVTCVKWEQFHSPFFHLDAGVRQGGVLSPYLFAIYIDSVIDKVCKSDFGCKIGVTSFSILVYADDILLLAPSVCALQSLFNICENELSNILMSINPDKTMCIRIGRDCKLPVDNLKTLNNAVLSWSKSIRYLGIFIEANFSFRCSLHNCKKSFYISFNSIYGKIGGVSNEDTILYLLTTKCLPKLLYGLEVIPLTRSQMNNLEFVIRGIFMKIFKTKCLDIITECLKCFDFDIGQIIETKKANFIKKLKKNASSNAIYRALLSL
jgi:hypothetical protein